MFEKIKALGTDTAIYGISTILGRFLTFILTPLYANLLTQAELGIVAVTFGYIAFLNVVYSYGMESAYFKYASTNELGDRRQNFTVPFISIVVSSLIFSSVILSIAPAVIAMTSVPSATIIRYAAVILALDAVAVVPFASLRLERKAKQFAAIRIAGILVTVALNFVLLIHYRMGLEGIFISNIAGSALHVALLMPAILRNLTRGWNTTLHRALLRFGLPYVPAGLAAMMIQVIDRPILEALTDPATVGIYQANYRIGIAMMLIVNTVDFAWKPFALSHASEPDAKPLFARILTYYVLFMTVVFLVVSFFIKEIVSAPLFWGRSILPESYWIGLPIVPVVMLGYICLGIFGNISAGIYIRKKTHLFPVITFVAAGINVAANLLLIPLFGLMGAAIATLASYAVMMVVGYVMVQRFFPVRYEFQRLAKIGVAAIAVYCAFLFLPAGDRAGVFKAGLLALFVFLMYAMKFFNASEIRRIVSLLSLRGQKKIVPPDGNLPL